MQPMLARQGKYVPAISHSSRFHKNEHADKILAPGRTVSSGVHPGGSNAKRTAGTATTTETLGSAAKLGRDKEREDLELKPPWELQPYCRDLSYGIPLPRTNLMIQGYPDFYPSKGTEEEYTLTEKAITEGFENKPIVSVFPCASGPFLIIERIRQLSLRQRRSVHTRQSNTSKSLTISTFSIMPAT
jgi:hypothetical protein